MTWWERIREALFPPGPDYAAIWSEVEPRVAAWRREAWRPVCAAAGEGLSHFGGVPVLESGFRWPVCGKCNQRMPLLLQLAATDIPHEARSAFPEGLLQVFYCLKCGWEPFTDAALIRAIACHTELQEPSERPRKVFKTAHIIDWVCVSDYPEPGDETAPEVDLSELEVEALFESGYPLQGDKLLGCPYWVQDPERPACPICDRPLTTLFQLDSNVNLDYMWGDAGVAHILWCADHKSVFALVWQCH